MKLDGFDSGKFDRGRPKAVEAAWIAAHVLFSSWVPGSAWRVWLLRLFGAHIGAGVVLKPGVRVKFPWRLAIGDRSWIGERAWIDNLAAIEIGSDCCVSQDAYLCTGNHDWASPSFDLIASSIRVADRAWIAARAVVAPGVKIGEGAVLALGAVALDDLEPWTVYRGNPAAPASKRKKP